MGEFGRKALKIKRKLSLGHIVLGLGFTNVAHAGVYAAGPAYAGDPTGTTMACRVFNAGLTGASVTARQIIDENGAAMPLAVDSCGALAPTKSCEFRAVATSNVGYSCRIYTTGVDDNLRGAFEIIVPLSQGISSVHLPLTK